MCLILKAVNNYFLFIFGTFVAACAYYFLSRALFGIAGALFFVFMLGYGHYIMGYIWSAPSYLAAQKHEAIRNLSAVTISGLIFITVIHTLRIVPFYYAVFITIMIAVVHNFRDYEFFYRQISSDFRESKRTIKVTAFLSSFFIFFLFGPIIADPEKSRALFGAVLPPEIFVYGFALAVLVFAFSGFLIFAKRSSQNQNSAYSKVALFMPVFIFPLGISAIIRNINPIDLVYFFTTWHFVMWLGYAAVKTRQKIYNRIWRANNNTNFFTAFISLWRINIYAFTAITAIMYMAIFTTAFLTSSRVSLYGFNQIVGKSFLWGIQGFILFSFVHILFTAIPKPRS